MREIGGVGFGDGREEAVVEVALCVTACTQPHLAGSLACAYVLCVLREEGVHPIEERAITFAGGSQAQRNQASVQAIAASGEPGGRSWLK